MEIELVPVTRENWEIALELQVSQKQRKFVPSVAVSLAKVYIKPDGDRVTYLPFAIYAHDRMVGFIMHAFEDGTSDMYWVNGFLIDANEQRKGYGRAALDKMITWISERFTLCQEIRLTVHKDNSAARSFYTKRGFVPTGEWFGEDEVLRLVLN